MDLKFIAIEAKSSFKEWPDLSSKGNQYYKLFLGKTNLIFLKKNNNNWMIWLKCFEVSLFVGNWVRSDENKARCMNDSSLGPLLVGPTGPTSFSLFILFSFFSLITVSFDNVTFLCQPMTDGRFLEISQPKNKNKNKSFGGKNDR